MCDDGNQSFDKEECAFSAEVSEAVYSKIGDAIGQFISSGSANFADLDNLADNVVDDDNEKNNSAGLYSDTSTGNDGSGGVYSEPDFVCVEVTANLTPEVLDPSVAYAGARATASAAVYAARRGVSEADSDFILDSGATHDMSFVEEDFCYINRQRRVPTTLADDKKVDSWFGIFKTNSNGLTVGLYSPNLAVKLLRPRGELILPAGEKSPPLYNGAEGYWRRGLPWLSVEFGDGESEQGAGAYVQYASVNSVSRKLQHERGFHLTTHCRVKNCATCRLHKSKGAKYSKSLGESAKQQKLELSFNDLVALDLVGPLPRSLAGNVYQANIVDRATGWTHSSGITDKASAHVALQKYVQSTYSGGLVKCIHMDNQTIRCSLQYKIAVLLKDTLKNFEECLK
jgi:hypothetical protein